MRRATYMDWFQERKIAELPLFAALQAKSEVYPSVKTKMRSN
jgi:hypothetical protein